jgi:hypothetical protein
LFEQGTYCHWDGYPTHMGKSWWEISKHEMFGGNLASLVEYFIQGNPVGWSIIDWEYDITKKPISTEKNQKLFGYKSPDEPQLNGSYDDPVALADYQERYAAWTATKPLVSFRARRWDIMEQFGYLSEAEAAKDRRCTKGAMWEDDNIITPESAGNQGCEWLYIFDIDARTLGVYKLYPDTTECGVFPLDGNEPNWAEIEGVEED